MAADPDARILLCIPRLSGGGAERQVRMLAPRLAGRGLGISLFSRFAGDEAADLEAAGIRCFPIRAAGNHDPRLVLELAGAARRARANIIHTWLTQMDVLGGAVALATGRKWVLSERLSPAGYGRGLKNGVRAQLGRFADIVVANSAAGIEVWPDHPRRMIIANGVDPEAIRRAPAAAVPAGRPLIVAVARLVPHKGTEQVVRAVAQLRPRHPEMVLAILGTGPEEQRLRALAGALGIADNVVFAGYRADVWGWIGRASLCVSASRYEGQPNAVLEAAAAGIPQVLSDIVMHRDAVGAHGALFADPADPAALAAGIGALLEAPDRARSLAASARSAVAALTIDRAADLYGGLYRGTAGSRAPPGTDRGARSSSAA